MTDAVISGRVVRIGDDVDTDVMLPGAYLNITDPQELGTHLLETYSDPEVGKRIEAGDILVAGRNCGMGSSREHAPLAMIGRGVQAVVAVSFARIFQRNCINLGLLAIE
jgi:3-isopropylmalate/(R)-2-methylmalate dehydratase small subunit